MPVPASRIVPMNRHPVLSRAAALDHLSAVLPRAGHRYAAERVLEAGPDREPTTTALSPFLRRRILLEQEVVEAVSAAHGPRAAGRLIEEVLWRSYFKGHLETHPSAWTRFVAAAGDETARLAAEPARQRNHEAAVSGRTGIDGFDAWARELVETGWLHNHARMWFASIWIFTLRLPWELGAQFFLRYLLDGDPASNTLSWRWVAGLHTGGRPYVARAENIRRQTGGRFAPEGLDEEDPAPIGERDPPPEVPLPPADAAPAGDVALLLHLDDLHPESLDLGAARVARVGGLLAHAPGASDQVRKADHAAMLDALARAGRHFNCHARLVTPGWNDGLPLVTAWAPVGPSASALPPGCLRLRRPWDEAVWPRSRRGYFRVRSAIPEILRVLPDR